MKGTLAVTGDPEADALLNSDPLALVIGMLFDQQVPIAWAFRAPATLRSRLGHLDAARIAAMAPDDLVAVCCEKPAVHRFPASMGRRAHELCQVLVERYDGRAEKLWLDVADATELRRRLLELPGFGEEKTMIFTALLAKRMGVAPKGWRDVAGPFADGAPRSAADIDSADSLAEVRQWKRAQKAAGRKKKD